MSNSEKEQFLSQVMLRTTRRKNGDTVEVSKGGQKIVLTHAQIKSLHALILDPAAPPSAQP